MRFVADPPLGQLAKWLRILGFDVLYANDQLLLDPRQVGGRIRLTRTRACIRGDPCNQRIFVRSNDPKEQIQQVCRALCLDRDAVSPFSRCLKCNTLLSPVEKEVLHGRVPDFVWETQRQFHQCPQCGRIYWHGSHIFKMNQAIDDLLSKR